MHPEKLTRLPREEPDDERYDGADLIAKLARGSPVCSGD